MSEDYALWLCIKTPLMGVRAVGGKKGKLVGDTFLCQLWTQDERLSEFFPLSFHPLVFQSEEFEHTTHFKDNS